MSPEHRGVFVAVVGPSGVGKDTLMSGAARHPELDPGVHFVRRIVTRAAVVASEDHDSLDEAGFDRAAAADAFSLAWAAHGLRYALPRSVFADLGQSHTVVANLSRRSLDDAVATFGHVHIVEVTARQEVLLERLTARGRESEAVIVDRLRRQVPMAVPPEAAGHLRLDNSGDLATTTDRLVSHLNRVGRR